MVELRKILEDAVSRKASDIHLAAGSPPAFRVDGKMQFVGETPLDPHETEALLDEVLNPRQKAAFLERRDYDLAVSIPGLGRFRTNVLTQRGSVGYVFRHVSGKILSFQDLHLPPVVQTIADLQRGLVLITGTTGSGKSTTLASIIDYINETRHSHIITLEDPIEFLYTNRKSVVTQREVVIDTEDFSTALRAAMRQDPDVILIGEMRDADTFQAAISASETGHLVFSTLHTSNAMLTIDRIVDLFPSNQQDQVRSQLSLQLKAAVAMRLLPKKDEKGRVPAIEVMRVSPAITALIKENNVKLIPNAIVAGREDGMQTFNMSLAGLVKADLVTEEVALLNSDNPDELQMNLQGIYLSQSRGGILKRHG